MNYIACEFCYVNNRYIYKQTKIYQFPMLFHSSLSKKNE